MARIPSPASWTPPRSGASKTAELLRDQHGETSARKLVRLEQQKARRARSRTRFVFWAAVAMEMEMMPAERAEPESIAEAAG
jgi:hypothetical protein